MRANLIHNPTAGDEQATAEDLVAILEQEGFQVRYQSTKKNWKKALQEPADLAIAAGGDGTVAKVLRHMAGSDIPVALLPIGTANNICRSLGVSGDLRELMTSWKKAEPRPFDIGLVSTRDGERRFVEACGGGLFALATERGREMVETATSYVGNEIDRALAMLHGIVADAPLQEWKVEVDGQDHSGSYVAVEVMNIRFAGPGVPIAPKAKPGDGVLNVVLIKNADRKKLLKYLRGRTGHEEVTLPELTTVRGKSIRLTPPDGRLRIDDEVHDGIQGHVDVLVRHAAVLTL